MSSSGSAAFSLTDDALQSLLTRHFCLPPGGLAGVLPSTRRNKGDADTPTFTQGEKASVFQPLVLHARWHVHAAGEVDHFSNKHCVKSRILLQGHLRELV